MSFYLHYFIILFHFIHIY